MYFLLFSGVNSDTPRTYKKVVGDRQTEAVEAYKSGRISLRSAAEKYGVKKSTLYDHVRSKSTKRQGVKVGNRYEVKRQKDFLLSD